MNVPVQRLEHWLCLDSKNGNGIISAWALIEAVGLCLDSKNGNGIITMLSKFVPPCFALIPKTAMALSAVARLRWD